MKAVNLQAPKTIFLTERDTPVRPVGMALLKIKAAGICGSDIGAYRGSNPLVSYPRILGHELAGEILDIDEDNPKGLKIGDRVVVDPYLYCGRCYPCSLGRTNCCENLKVLGVHIDGGMAEYFVHPSNMLIPIPDNIPWELAPLAEPLTIALHGLHRGGLSAGMHIAINGAGAIGLLAAMAAKAYGAEPILIDLEEERLSYARKLGVKHTIDLTKQDVLSEISKLTNARMAEVVMEASGANSAIRNSLNMVSYAGAIVLTGWPKAETQLSTDLITKKELNIYGSRTSAGEFEEALTLISEGTVDAASVLSKIVSLDEAADAVTELSEHPGRYLKVHILF